MMMFWSSQVSSTTREEEEAVVSGLEWESSGDTDERRVGFAIFELGW